MRERVERREEGRLRCRSERWGREGRTKKKKEEIDILKKGGNERDGERDT